MEYNRLTFILLSIVAAYFIGGSHAYNTGSPILTSVHALKDGDSDPEAPPMDIKNMEGGLDHIASSLEKQKAGLESIKNALESFALNVAKQAEKQPQGTDISSAVLHDAYRQALYAKGMQEHEVEEVFDDVINRLRSSLFPSSKRGWNRFSVHTRFAPFGTKLVPNRKFENGGATLLRYGRSARAQ